MLNFAASLYHIPCQSIDALCKRLRIPLKYCQLAQLAARYHRSIIHMDTLQPQELVDILSKTDAYRRPERFEKLLILCEAIIMCYDEKKFCTPYWREILHAIRQIKSCDCVHKEDPGHVIQEKFYQARISCVTNILTRITHDKK